MRPSGYKTKRGQFYGSLTAMPAHERSTAKPLYELPEDATFEVQDGTGAVMSVSAGPREAALAEATRYAARYPAGSVQVFEVLRVPVVAD